MPRTWRYPQKWERGRSETTGPQPTLATPSTRLRRFSGAIVRRIAQQGLRHEGQQCKPRRVTEAKMPDTRGFTARQDWRDAFAPLFVIMPIHWRRRRRHGSSQARPGGQSDVAKAPFRTVDNRRHGRRTTITSPHAGHVFARPIREADAILHDSPGPFQLASSLKGKGLSDRASCSVRRRAVPSASDHRMEFAASILAAALETVLRRPP